MTTEINWTSLVALSENLKTLVSNIPLLSDFIDLEINLLEVMKGPGTKQDYTTAQEALSMLATWKSLFLSLQSSTWEEALSGETANEKELRLALETAQVLESQTGYSALSVAVTAALAATYPTGAYDLIAFSATMNTALSNISTMKKLLPENKLLDRWESEVRTKFSMALTIVSTVYSPA